MKSVHIEMAAIAVDMQAINTTEANTIARILPQDIFTMLGNMWVAGTSLRESE